MVVVTPDPTTKTWEALFPLTARLVAPGPLMVMFVLMSIGPEVRMMTGHDVGSLTVSPDTAAATWARREPAPESLQFITLNMLAPAT